MSLMMQVEATEFLERLNNSILNLKMNERPGYDVKLHPDVQAFNVPFLELYIRNCFVVMSRYNVLSLLLKRIIKTFHSC